jgi:hypothetical protein
MPVSIKITLNRTPNSMVLHPVHVGNLPTTHASTAFIIVGIPDQELPVTTCRRMPLSQRSPVFVHAFFIVREVRTCVFSKPYGASAKCRSKKFTSGRLNTHLPLCLASCSPCQAEIIFPIPDSVIATDMSLLLDEEPDLRYNGGKGS